jgi:hypothetical protein
MSLRTLLNDLAADLGIDVGVINRLVTGDALNPSLTSLTTTQKASIVAALNEVNALAKAAAASGGADIDDTTSRTTTVYSSSKVDNLIAQARQAILGTDVPAVLDTLDELAAAIGDDPNFAATLTTALGNRLRLDTAQSLTDAQRAQGRTNLGAIAAADVGDTTTSLVAVYRAAKQ